MKTHILKLNEQFCEQVNCGIKTFEIRFNDRDYHVSDHIIFRAVDVCGFEIYHAINDKEYEITYVLSGWGLKGGYVVLAIKEIKK